MWTSVSDLTGRSKVKSVLDRGEKERARTFGWEMNRGGVEDELDEGSS